MKSYLITTGTVFALVAIAHVWRVVSESNLLAADPWFVLLTVVCAAMAGWAFTLLRRTTRA
jgi:hypothetical protein